MTFTARNGKRTTTDDCQKSRARSRVSVFEIDVNSRNNRGDIVFAVVLSLSLTTKLRFASLHVRARSRAFNI